jgi:hypothetical protein
MGFRENLLKKIAIKRLTKKVVRSINPVDSSARIDSDAMRQLLAMGAYPYQKERDLDLFRLSENHILLLDNELKIYNTTAEDIGLRKSPTVKEMLSIRNAIKILSDKDVVASRKAETVQRVQQDLIDSLDLSYTEADIESMAGDGMEAHKNNYVDGMLEILNLFAEILGFEKAPKAFRINHHHIWGKTTKSNTGDRLFGPMIILGLMHNNLKIYQKSISSTNRQQMQEFQQIVKGKKEADYCDEDVWAELSRAALALPRTRPT